MNIVVILMMLTWVDVVEQMSKSLQYVTMYSLIQKDAYIGLSHLTIILWESFEKTDNFSTGPGTKTNIVLKHY